MVGHLDMTLVLLTILSIAIPSTTQTTKSSNELYSWSYWGEGDLDKFDLGYQPLLEACGNGSCGNCLGYNGSVPEPCDGHTLHNSCFKPYLGETCCKDNSGTACMYGYHCAYDVNNDGFCCADNGDHDDCESHLGKSLATTQRLVTVIVTQKITATMGDVSQTNEAPPVNTNGSIIKTDGQDSSSGLGVGAKVGIALGAFFGIGGLLGVGVILYLRKRRAHTPKDGDTSSGDLSQAHHRSASYISAQTYLNDPRISMDPTVFGQAHGDPHHEKTKTAHLSVSPPLGNSTSPLLQPMISPPPGVADGSLEPPTLFELSAVADAQELSDVNRR